jgi:hypothetical protein
MTYNAIKKFSPHHEVSSFLILLAREIFGDKTNGQGSEKGLLRS